MGSSKRLVSYHTNLENDFLTMAYKLPLPSPLIYHAPYHNFLHHHRRLRAIITLYGRHQKNRENPSPRCDFAVLLLIIFQFNRCIVGKSAIMISLLTERFCPCRRCSPIALITKEQRHKKNGQRRLIFEDFSVLLLTFCQLNCCCRPQLATWDIYAHRQDITTPLMPLPLIAILNIYPIF
jgi:hypothetical protein